MRAIHADDRVSFLAWQSVGHALSRLGVEGALGESVARRMARTLTPQKHEGVFRVPEGFGVLCDASRFPGSHIAAGVYETQTRRAMRRLLRRGDVFVTCGASIGYLAAVASGIVGPNGKVYAVEPNPGVHPALRKNRSLAPNPGIIEIEEWAAGDEPGTAFLNVPRGHQDRASFNDLTLPSERVRVEVRRLDTLPTPDVALLDAEGYEHELLNGASGWFAGKRWPTLLMEDNSGQRAGEDPVQMLTSRGYLARGLDGKPFVRDCAVQTVLLTPPKR